MTDEVLRIAMMEGLSIIFIPLQTKEKKEDDKSCVNSLAASSRRMERSIGI